MKVEFNKENQTFKVFQDGKGNFVPFTQFLVDNGFEIFQAGNNKRNCFLKNFLSYKSKRAKVGYFNFRKKHN